MTVRLFNTMSKEKEELIPLNGKRLNVYVCGPTTYDFSHLGHGRTYISFDMIIKYLRFRGFDVFYLMNITDIDDKIINRANESGRNWKELAHDFADKFKEDMNRLHVNSMSRFQNASDSISSMIKNIQILLDKGNAYIIADDGVYFDISSFPEYGKLSHQNVEDLKAGSRVDVNDKKKNPYDFALWKFKKPGEPSWEAPFGEGRPGWHIECSSMCNDEFGPTLDIHGGGRDLIFPHHECEIAQAESASGKKFVNYWIHTGFLNISGEKMSKSLGNFKTIRDILKTWKPEVIRLFAVSNHYRSPVDFNPESLEASKNSLERITNAYYELNEALKKPENILEDEDKEMILNIKSHKEKLIESMDDDFNSPLAIAEFYNFIKDLNKYMKSRRSGQVLEAAKKLFDDTNGFFDILPKEDASADTSAIAKSIYERLVEKGYKSDKTEATLDDLVEIRENLRKEKNFALSDFIRDQFNENGLVLEDGKEGAKWKIKG
ncbi:MAG: cysteine--tRNA ligase [Candidatus Aenigmarchaeota archaeon]|nr:cysteine--tRNA ligase [Candidatus Aenigmarchaeota archaeon]